MAEQFSGKKAAEIVGITYRQLDYWARTDLVRPSVTDASGSGSRRKYSYRDLLELKVVKSLLDAGIRLAASRHEEFRALEAEVTKAQQALEDRKLIEQAKGILIAATGIPEPEAFRRIQRAARDRNVRLVDVARRIVEQRSLLDGTA